MIKNRIFQKHTFEFVSLNYLFLGGLAISAGKLKLSFIS